jgi:hypothetical protein
VRLFWCGKFASTKKAGFQPVCRDRLEALSSLPQILLRGSKQGLGKMRVPVNATKCKAAKTCHEYLAVIFLLDPEGV